MPGPSRSNRDAKQSPQGRLLCGQTHWAPHSTDVSNVLSWLLLAREAQAMQGQLLPCQANLDVLRITQAKPLPVQAVVR